jgi:hypothetical protein
MFAQIAVSALLRKASILLDLLLYALIVITLTLSLYNLYFSSAVCGTGKTTVGLSLISMLKECVVLEQDILWGM